MSYVRALLHLTETEYIYITSQYNENVVLDLD